MNTSKNSIEKVFLVGATSGIAKQVARIYAGKHAELYLVGRNEELLEGLAQDLVVRGASKVEYATLDVNNMEEHEKIIDQAFEYLGSVNIAILAHGTLPDQQACETDINQALLELNTNGVSSISLLTLLGSRFKLQSAGTIAVITSVAGDRGRRSNYVYGAAKAMISTFLEGFRGMLVPYNVDVLDIKPGFVDTPMTAHIDNKGVLWASPDLVAATIVKAIQKKRSVIYTPFFWRWIMLIVCAIPTPIFKRLKF